jgi:hypothetical protein
MKNIKEDLRAITALEKGGKKYSKWARTYKISKAQNYIRNLPAKISDDFRYFILSRFIFPGYRKPRVGTPETGFFIAESTKEKEDESIS